ncbi:MAG: SdiA-regulated domain-containing protein [Saprospiraceae bacterium]|nr:SdiA-regulated domain-containing protein [Saprospiraceae bacterium]
MIPFFLILALFYFECKNSVEKKSSANTSITAKDSFRYDLNEPNTKFKLTKKLKEISGLTCYKDKWLFAVQDERGAMYRIDIKSGEIKDVIKFYGDGDFEGIASNDSIFYVIRADGVLFKINDWEKKKKIKSKKIKTHLGSINDTEGLAYDPVSNDLIIACKGSSAIGYEAHKSRSVYAYDLDSANFNITPVCTITRKKFKKFIKENFANNPEYKPYKKEIKEAKKSIIIKPSAIAVHPITKNYYILSAISNTLIVMDRSSNIKHIKRLSKKQFEQAEGIAFSTDGDLFISSEGLKKKARIYKFDYIPK